MGLLLGLDNY